MLMPLARPSRVAVGAQRIFLACFLPLPRTRLPLAHANLHSNLSCNPYSALLSILDRFGFRPTFFSSAGASSRSDDSSARRPDTTLVARLHQILHILHLPKTVHKQCLTVRPAISRGQRLQAECPPDASQTATPIATVSISSILWRLSRTQTSRTILAEASQQQIFSGQMLTICFLISQLRSVYAN